MTLKEFLHVPEVNEAARWWSLWWIRKAIRHPVIAYRILTGWDPWRPERTPPRDAAKEQTP